MWRKELKEDSHFFYGYGCQIKQRKSPERSEPSREDRRHPRRPFNKPVRFAIEDRVSEGLASDISPSGVLVKSGRQPRAGQVVTLRIPDKTGKGLIVKGRVVWSNGDGFGLKFIAMSLRKGRCHVPSAFNGRRPEVNLFSSSVL